jgi:hypothetical protein
MAELKELLDQAAPRPQRALDLADLERTATRQRTILRAAGGLFVAMVVALVAVVLVLGQESDTGDLDTAAPEQGTLSEGVVEEGPLFGATAVVTQDELWVLGGQRPPEPVETPPTTVPAWPVNEIAQQFDSEGRLERSVELPLDGSRLSDPTVITRGDARFVIGTRCEDVSYCTDPAEPVLIAVDGTDAQLVRLTVPEAEFGEDVGAGRISVVGHDDRLIWAVQDLGLGSTRPVGGHRLLAVAFDGTVSEVALPGDVHDTGAVCAGEDGVFVATAGFDERSEVDELTLYNRSSVASGEEWRELATVPLDVGYVGGGSLSCDAAGEVIVALTSTPPTVTAIDVATGDVTTPLTALSDVGAGFVGTIDGVVIIESHRSDEDARVLWRRERDRTLTPLDAEVDRKAILLVIDDRLVDAQRAVQALSTTGVDLEAVDTEP